MISRITISQAVEDARADIKKKQFNALNIQGKVKSLSIIDSYTIDAGLKKDQLKKSPTFWPTNIWKNLILANWFRPENLIG